MQSNKKKKKNPTYSPNLYLKLKNELKENNVDNSENVLQVIF
jgi:hypothetical protein